MPPGEARAVQPPDLRYTPRPPAQSVVPSVKTTETIDGLPGRASALQVPSTARFQSPSPVAAQVNPCATAIELTVLSESPSNAQAPEERRQTPRYVPAQSVAPSPARAFVSAPFGPATCWKRSPARAWLAPKRRIPAHASLFSRIVTPNCV